MYDFDVIETPENIVLERRLAGIGSRFLAGLVDNLLLALLYLILGLLLMGILSINPFNIRQIGSLESIGLVLWFLAFFLIYWGYFCFFEWLTNGQSPGKKYIKIRVVKDGGGAITFTDIAIRNLLRVVDSLPGAYAVAGVCMFISRKTQRLGDLAASTVVISEQPLEYSAKDGKKRGIQWEQEISPESLRVTGLTPEELRLLHNYSLRRSELTLQARQRVLPKLILPILQRLGHEISDSSMENLEYYVDYFLQLTQNTNNPETLPPKGNS